jgi:hypothetical protein
LTFFSSWIWSIPSRKQIAWIQIKNNSGWLPVAIYDPPRSQVTPHRSIFFINFFFWSLPTIALMWAGWNLDFSLNLGLREV